MTSQLSDKHKSNFFQHIESDKPPNASDTLNEDLTGIQQWADTWFVKISVPKTKFLTCGNKKKHYLPITFNVVQIEPVENYTYLVLTWSSNLGWIAHTYCILGSTN